MSWTTKIIGLVMVCIIGVGIMYGFQQAFA